MLRAQKYRIYPNKEQVVLMDKHFGCSRFIYNWGLDIKNKYYQEHQKSISIYEVINKLPDLKKDKPFLKEVNSLSLQKTLINLESAFSAFFKKNSDFPKFKCKNKSKDSFQVVQNVVIEGNKLYLPKFKKPIKIVISKDIIGEIRTCTVSRNSTGKYFISVLVENGAELPKATTKGKAIGIDLGIKTFVTLSGGVKIYNPKHLTKKEKYLKKQQRILSRRKKGSKRRDKQRKKVARIHEKIANQRSDFHHKLSRKIVDENQVIVIEDLAIANMVKNRCLAKAIQSCGWGEFTRQLAYKAEWKGHTIVKIGRFQPSSKMCTCGAINNNLKLSDRTWTCPSCGTTHDRDVLAANNILKFGLLKLQSLGQELPESTLGESDKVSAMKPKCHSVNRESARSSA